MLGKCFFICPGVILWYLAVIIAKKYVFVFRNIPVRLFNLYNSRRVSCYLVFMGVTDFLKVWWPYAILFCIFITLLQYMQSFTHNIRWGSSLYLHSCRLSGRNLPGVPSRDSNSGLPYSKPAHYQLSCAAIYWAALHPTELRCTDFYVSWHLRFLTFSFCVLYVLWRNTFCDAVRYVTFTFRNFYVLCSYYLCSYV